MPLRPYQTEVIKDLYAKIRKGFKKILLVAATGAGKTKIACQIMSDISRQKKVCYFIVDREDLVIQTAQALSREGLKCGYIKAGFKEDRNALIQVCSVQTMKSRDWWKSHDINVIIFDEAHETAFWDISKDMMANVKPDILYIGLTATPYRASSKENMGDIFQTMVSAPVPKVLMDAGFLTYPVYYSLDKPDLSGVKSRNGDYAENDLKVVCDVPDLIKKTVEEWQKITPGKRTIAFCVNVEHANNLTAAFRAAKVPAVTITGDTKQIDRQRYYADVKKGNLLVLVTIGIASKGLDVPCLEVALLCRPTKSKALCEQQIGRVLRPSPETGKENAWILDQAGNIKTFGLIEDKKRYTLNRTQESDGDNPPPLKECPRDDGGCGAYLYGFQMICPQCGHIFTAAEHELVIHKLVRVFSDPNEERRFQQYQRDLKDAYERKHSPGIALTKMQQHGASKKTFPKKDWGRCAVMGENPIPIDYYTYYQHLKRLQKQKGKEKPDSWVKRYMTIEFGDDWERTVDYAADSWEEGKLARIGVDEEGNRSESTYFEWVAN